MITLHSKWMWMVTTVVILSLFTTGFAVPFSEIDGTGPDMALVPTGETMEIEAGEYHWYAFNYDFDEDVTEPVVIKIFSEPAGGAVLTVRNAEQAEMWRQDGTQEHLGCCTVQELNDDDETDYAVWAGELFSSGTYYIVVEHAKDLTGPVSYHFTIDGPGVSLPEAEAPMSEPAPVADTTSAEMTGTGPDMALVPTGETMEIEAGEYHWYAFTYDFDEDVTEPVVIKIFSEPAGGAVLTVRNAEQAEMWRQDGTQEHLGCCTIQELNDDDVTDYAVWAGELFSSGTYYIVIGHAKDLSGPVSYHFTIDGPGVSY